MKHPDILEFQGEFRFLSNFWLAPLCLDGLQYPSVEHAYQAAKTTDAAERAKFQSGDAGLAKRNGRRLKSLRPDWDAVKVEVMTALVRAKFQLHPQLEAKLLATGDCQIIEGNHWGDRFWGVCRGVGENRLGQILMQVRAELRG